MQNYLDRMKRIFFYMMLCCVAMGAMAQTFDCSTADSRTIDGVTVSFGKGTGNVAPTVYDNGLRLYAGNTVTVSGSGLTTISLTFTKQGTKAYAPLSASEGTLTGGGESTSADDLKTDVWNGSANTVTFTVGTPGQRLIKQIAVGAGGGTTPTDTTTVDPGQDDPGTEGPDTLLAADYDYPEPTVVTAPADSFSNQAYTFVSNNIRVSTSLGAIRSTYFGCNAGQTITLTATRPIKGISAHAFLKKDFAATASSGTLYLADASDTITADPAIVVTDVDATSLTLSCTKQVRFYAIRVYFEDNPDTDIDNPQTGDLDFSYEPQEQTTFAMTFDSVYYADDTDNLGYACSYLYFVGTEHMMDLVVFCRADARTGIPAGTYPIDATYAANTVMASPGGDEYMDYPSCIYTDFDTEGYYNAAYYLASGSLTVSATENGTRLELAATTHWGSTVSTVYEGAVYSDSDTAVEETEAGATARKMLLDGRVVILRGGRMYDALGRNVR